MARGILFRLKNSFTHERELFIRAPETELFISFRDRCDPDIGWINLFRVRHGTSPQGQNRIQCLAFRRPYGNPRAGLDPMEDAAGQPSTGLGMSKLWRQR